MLQWFTRRWQDHKKVLQIKVDLVTKVSRLTSEVLAEAFSADFDKKSDITPREKEIHRKRVASWYTTMNLVSASLYAYTRDRNIQSFLVKELQLLMDYYYSSRYYFIKDDDTEGQKFLSEALANIRSKLSNVPRINNLSTTYDSQLWSDIGDALHNRANLLARVILETKFKGF